MTPSNRMFDQLMVETHEKRIEVLEHLVYGKISNLDALRIFMEHHVIAVWDFMTLLKSLQRRLTCVDLPWRPVSAPNAARIINEIVLVEESDEVAPGQYLSHFEMYLAAMREAGASTAAVESLVYASRDHLQINQQNTQLPAACDKFTRTTFQLADAPVHMTAAAFLMGRENLVPSMFERMLPNLPSSEPRYFRLYLERHIAVDGDQHGPLARQLLVSLCGDDRKKWTEAAEATATALNARRELWDAILTAITKSGKCAQSSPA